MTELTELEILQDLLICEKFMVGMYKQFTIEASNPALKNLLIENMKKAFEFQFKIFELMHERDLYPTEPAETKKITTAIKTLREKSKDYSNSF